MKLNTPNLFNFLLLVSFVYGVRVDSGYNMKQREIATKTKLRNNWDETPETAITSLITMVGEKKIESELNNLTKHNFKIREKLPTYENVIGSNDNFYRNIRNVIKKAQERDMLECYKCFGRGISKKDEDCYGGFTKSSEKCIYGQQCYIELQKDFIKRGCVYKNRMNRTFVCKCPLCNDKPSDNPIYYNYEKINDWKFHNQYIQLPSKDLICKICETRERKSIVDSICRFGKNADYMVCGPNQVCYTNINDEANVVSRGCMNKPVSNSFLIFCDKTLCNNNSYDNPRRKRYDDSYFRAPPVKVMVSKSCNNNSPWELILLAYMILLLS